MRGQKGFTLYSEVPAFLDKIISAISYLPPFGFICFLGLILFMVIGKQPKTFLKFNVFQSALIYMIFFAVSYIYNFILAILLMIPFVGNVISFLDFYTLHWSIIWGFSFIDGLAGLLILYLIIMSCMGQYSKVPYISENVRKMV